MTLILRGISDVWWWWNGWSLLEMPNDYKHMICWVKLMFRNWMPESKFQSWRSKAGINMWENLGWDGAELVLIANRKEDNLKKHKHIVSRLPLLPNESLEPDSLGWNSDSPIYYICDTVSLINLLEYLFPHIKSKIILIIIYDYCTT